MPWQQIMTLYELFNQQEVNDRMMLHTLQITDTTKHKII